MTQNPTASGKHQVINQASLNEYNSRIRKKFQSLYDLFMLVN